MCYEQRISSVLHISIESIVVCFSFIGPGHYHYIAGVCRNFREVYSIKYGKKTTWKVAAANVACAEVCRKDSRFAAPFEIACVAIETGNLKVLEWARTRGSDFIPGMFLRAAENGHVSVLKWAADRDLDWFVPLLTAQAAQHGHVNFLEYIWKGNRFHINTGMRAAAHGQISVLSWMKERNMLEEETTPRMLWLEAIFNEQINVLNWLLDEGYEIDPELLPIAVIHGHYNVLLWAKAHNLWWNARTCAYAALHGNLTMLQWLRENECPWNNTVIVVARSRGHGHIVEWAIENGCPQV